MLLQDSASKGKIVTQEQQS